MNDDKFEEFQSKVISRYINANIFKHTLIVILDY